MSRSDIEVFWNEALIELEIQNNTENLDFWPLFLDWRAFEMLFYLILVPFIF